MLNCVELASDANQEYSLEQVRRQMIMQMNRIEQMKPYVREWKKKSRVAMTINNLEQHFIEAYQEIIDEEEDMDDVIEKKINNIIDSEYIKTLLASEEDNTTIHNERDTEFANMMAQNQELIKMMKDLSAQVDTLKKANNSRGQPNNNQNNGKGKGKMAWRKIAPKEGESTTKMFEGMQYEYCGTCNKGEGLWTCGEGKHGTKEHDPSKRK